MKIFKILLVFQFIGILLYTFLAGTSFGWDIFTVFTNNLVALNWSGQFNFDFLCYLVLSGLWVAWRNHFSITGIIQGIIASILGILFFAPYLLLIITQNQGEILPILLGPKRAQATLK